MYSVILGHLFVKLPRQKKGADPLIFCGLFAFRAGDQFITDATGKLFKNKKVEKGIGFPTCISVNFVVGHYSPFDNDSTSIVEGDMCKMYAPLFSFLVDSLFFSL